MNKYYEQYSKYTSAGFGLSHRHERSFFLQGPRPICWQLRSLCLIWLIAKFSYLATRSSRGRPLQKNLPSKSRPDPRIFVEDLEERARAAFLVRF